MPRKSAKPVDPTLSHRWPANLEERLAIRERYLSHLGNVPVEGRRLAFEQLLAAVKTHTELPAETLVPVAIGDPDRAIVSSAALAIAVLAAPTDDDALAGPRRVVEQAEALADEPERAGVMLQGVLLTGDPRAVALVAEARGRIPREAQRTLAYANSGFLHAAVLEFYVAWLESRPDKQLFDTVASGLHSLWVGARVDSVVDVRRRFGDRGRGLGLEVLEEWDRADYVAQLEDRLLALRRKRPGSRKLPGLLYDFGIEAPNRRDDFERAPLDGASSRRPVNRQTALVFRPRGRAFSDWNSGTFSQASVQAHVDRMNHAVGHAKTWGELRALLPEGEFEALPLWLDNGGYCVYDDGNPESLDDPDVRSLIEDGDEDTVVRHDSPVNYELIPEFFDGDWPPFLAPLQDEFLPAEFCEKYGTLTTSFVSGSWWEFPVERADEMKAELEALGFTVDVQIPDPEPEGDGDAS